MPFDGSGNFTRSYNFVQDKTNGIKIVASRMDGEFDNFATAMNQAFLRNGLVPMTGSLNMGTNTINSIGDGTVGTPALRFNSDPTTGIYIPGYGKVAFTAGGVNRLEANSVGVQVTGALNASGATTLQSTLNVGGAATFGSSITAGDIAGVAGTFTSGVQAVSYTSTTTNNPALIVSTNAAIRDTTNGASTMSFDVSSGGVTHGAFQFRSSSAFTARMYIDSSGRLGVNTTSPLQMLHVNGAVSDVDGTGFDQGQAVFTDSDNSTSSGLIVGYRFQSGVAEYGRIQARNSVGATSLALQPGGGRVGIGISTPAAPLHVLGTSGSMQAQFQTAAGSGYGLIQFGGSGTASQNWHHGSDGAGNYVFYNGNAGTGTERMRMTSAGFLSIGAGVPGYLLDVGGYIRSSDTLLVGNNTTGWGRFTNAGQALYIQAGTLDSGSATANPIIFTNMYGGTERMRLDASGRLGIGTNNPSYVLEAIQNGTTNIGMRVQNQSTTQFAGSGLAMTGNSGAGTQGGAALYFYNANVGGTQGAVSLTQTNFVGSYQRTLFDYDFNTQRWAFMTNGTARLIIDSTGGIISADLANAIGYKGLPQNQQTGAYTLALSDMGKHMYITAGTFALTIPNNATVAFPVGTAITIINEDAVKTVAPGAGVTLARAGDGATGTRTLAIGAVATLVKVQTDRWYISGAGVS